MELRSHIWRNLIILVLTQTAAVSLCHAEDLLTTDGKSYKNVRVSGETTDKVKIMHDGGITQVLKITIPSAFLVLHEITAPVQAAADQVKNPQEAALAAFKASTPKFIAKDGREFLSADIKAIDAGGVKLITSTGIVRLAFTDLPEKVRTALNYDAAKSQAFNGALNAKRSADAETLRRLNDAASTVDMFGKRVRLLLLQNHDKAWTCAGQVLRDVKVDVATSRAGSPLSGPKVITEFSKKEETVVVAEIERVAVFGLSSYANMTTDEQGRRTWAGIIYRIGNYRWVGASTGKEVVIDACVTNRAEAIKAVAEHGNSATYLDSGIPEAADARPRSGSASGTGFAITASGHVATAAHVVKDATQIDVIIGSQTLPAHVVAVDKELDVAILKVDTATTRPLLVTQASTAKLGAELFSVGYPLISQLGTNAKLTKGALNALSGLNDDPHTFQMSVQIQPGNSGGPVCDERGNVIGIVSKTTSTIAAARGGAGAIPQNVNFAVKADELQALAKTINLALPVSIPSPTSPTQSVLDSTYLVRVEFDSNSN